VQQIREGTDEIVSDRLGHSSTSITADLYSHVPAGGRRRGGGDDRGAGAALPRRGGGCNRDVTAAGRGGARGGAGRT
jgi:hypothetical protein